MNNLFGNSFTTDDLLSTHPIINDNLIYPNEDLIIKNDEDFKKKMDIELQLREKIIIISSKDRNYYTESINNFSIFFNPSDDSFERYPVYYNNPTIPQTYQQRIDGVKGDPNINGWKDKDNNIYPAYNPNKPSGEIITYDSLFISGSSKSSIVCRLNNIVSIKVQKVYIFEQENINNNKLNIFTNSKSSFISVNLSNVDSNIITNFNNNKKITDLLYKDQRFLGWWLSISNSEFKYHPPINSLNSININWSYGYKLNQEENKPIYDKVTNFNNNNNFNQDILIIYGFEVSNNFIILKTSFFSDQFWEDRNVINIKNLKLNVDYSYLNDDQKSNINSLVYFLTSQDHEIVFTSLVLNNEDIYQQVLESNNNTLINEFQDLVIIKNRIIINIPISLKLETIALLPESFLKLDTNEYNNIGNEKIKLPNRNILLSNIMTQSNQSIKIQNIESLYNTDYRCLRVSSNEWLSNKGPLIINISKQSIIVLKVTYLEPIIQSQNQDNIHNLIS